MAPCCHLLLCLVELHHLILELSEVSAELGIHLLGTRTSPVAQRLEQFLITCGTHVC